MLGWHSTNWQLCHLDLLPAVFNVHILYLHFLYLSGFGLPPPPCDLQGRLQLEREDTGDNLTPLKGVLHLAHERLIATYQINTNQQCFCLCLLSSSCLFMLSQRHPCNSMARTIIFFLQAPFKFSLFKSRFNLPFVLALAVQLESSPMASLIGLSPLFCNLNSCH